jgi:hypothetical protein
LDGKPQSTWSVYTFLFSVSPCQKNLDQKKSNLLKTPFGRRRMTYTVPCLTRLNLWEIVFRLWTNSLPFQLLKHNCNISSMIFHSAFVNLWKWIGYPNT